MKIGGLQSKRGAICLIALLAASVWPSRADNNQPATVVGSDELGGKDRYLACISTDKPIYRSGENIYLRSVVLRADDRSPINEAGPGFFQITGPKGNIVASGYANSQDSTAGFAWAVPEGLPGGEYKAKVIYPQIGTPPAERTFDIRAYRAPRIKTQIVFFRDGYGPGDSVGAILEATRAEGGFPDKARVTITARVDGEEVHRSTATIDGAGHCTALFKLPAKIARSEGSLAFTIEDGGVVETAIKTIPILLQTVDLSIYPEGGDLVAGLPCRVYLEARTPFQKPADIAGIVVDDHGKQVGAFRTEHEGRGRFVFVPEKEARYSLKITEPSGIDKRFPLPAVLPAGTILTATRDIYQSGSPVVLRVHSTEAGPLKVTLRKREQELAAFEIKAGETTSTDVTLTPPASADGVLIATVWNADGTPLAERLVYRDPAQHVHLKIEVDRSRYIPGGHATVTVHATDDRGKPVEALVGLTVTDDSVLELVEKREQAPSLPVMVLLEPEVRELADAHIYFDPANPNAPRDLDLLLGTQGWRRFAFVHTEDFLRQYGDEARRILAMRIINRNLTVGGAGGMADELDAIGDMSGVQFAAPMGRAGGMVANRKAGSFGPASLDGASEMKEALMAGEELRDKDRFVLADREAAKRPERRLAPFVVVREYGHTIRPDRQPNDRIDFAETLYWNAGVRTDPTTGMARVSFDLSDAVSSYRVMADAFTTHGALGSAEQKIESVQPFYAEPKLPLEVTMGDEILLPIGIVNGTESVLDNATLTMTAAKGIDISAIAPFTIGADSRIRRLAKLLVGNVAGTNEFVLNAVAGPYSDKVTRPLRVVPRGFPVETAKGGMLGPNSPLKFQIHIPDTRVASSVTSVINVYPTPLANLTAALERLIQEPNGCFEQTSSTTYPLVMAQQYFTSHQGVDPKLIERSRDVLARGYTKLTGFECDKHGYEWFGQSPGHETLTAYGLLEFNDMSKVYGVDAAMMQRTREWLLGVRDGAGGFKRERRALHTWIEDKDCSNAYITWALLAAGESPQSLTKEIETVKTAALKSANSYVIALGANVAWMAGDKPTFKTLSDKLAERCNRDGYVDGGTATIVGSGGLSLQIETTALTLLAWLQEPAYSGAVEAGIKWLADVCEGGRYGSTQSTVLALRAILAYDAARSAPRVPGSIQMRVDGHQAGSPVKFDEKTSGPIKLTDIAGFLEPGDHVIELAMTDGSAMPCSMAIRYSDETPASSKECKVGLTVKMPHTRIDEGTVTEADVTVVNREEDAIIPSPIAIIGIPGGLEVRHDQLKELVKSGRIAAYEVMGRDVILYWRDLPAGKKVELPISLVAAIPGTYTGPASRAYLYYTDEDKQWADPVQITIEPAK